MLQRPNSQTPLLGVLTEKECPRCGCEVELPLGELCLECRAKIEQRARKFSRLISGVTTLILAVYIYVRMPQDRTARLVGVIAVVVWFVLTGLIARRTMREYRR